MILSITMLMMDNVMCTCAMLVMQVIRRSCIKGDIYMEYELETYYNHVMTYSRTISSRCHTGG